MIILKRKKQDSSIVCINAIREFLEGKSRNKSKRKNLDKMIDTYGNKTNIDKYSYIDAIELEEPVNIPSCGTARNKIA